MLSCSRPVQYFKETFHFEHTHQLTTVRGKDKGEVFHSESDWPKQTTNNQIN